MVGIQEAVHFIDKQPLVIRSDNITKISLSQCQALRSKEDDDSRTDVISAYRKRRPEHHHHSLEQFFYNVFCREKLKEDKKHRILMTQGLNCRPVYPADFYYARGMLFLHKPWHKGATLDKLFKDKEKTIETFKLMLDEGGFPTSVHTQYELARKYSKESKIECIASQGVGHDEEPNEEDMDFDEYDDYLANMNYSSKTDAMQVDDILSGDKVDLGLEHNWTVPFFKGDRDLTAEGEEYLNDLQKRYYTDRESSLSLNLPKTRHGENYSIDNLNYEQKIIVLGAVDAVIKFLTNDPLYKPFRATVLGCGGTGKSFIINTIITIIRQLTKNNDSIKVAAPTGGAAYNVQGCTIHRLLNVDVDRPWRKLSDDRKRYLQANLKDLLCLLIDERSMIQSKVICCAERNLRQTAFGGQNSKEYWGGLPVVLLFGDDYQLPPVKNQGAIEGFGRLYCKTSESVSKQNKDEQAARHRGDHLFTTVMTEDVFELTKNMRVTGDSRDFQQLQGRLRIGEQNESDAEKLTNLGLNKYDDEFIRHLESDEGTMWLYAKNADKNEQNLRKLKETSKSMHVPVARINCHYESNRKGHSCHCMPVKNHFKYVSYPRQTNICVHSMVAIDNVNFIPEIGLYNGARGKVVDIIFNKPEGPNDKQHKHLPDYVVVDFPDLKLPPEYEPWDKNNKTVSLHLVTFFL